MGSLKNRYTLSCLQSAFDLVVSIELSWIGTSNSISGCRFVLRNVMLLFCKKILAVFETQLVCFFLAFLACANDLTEIGKWRTSSETSVIVMLYEESHVNEWCFYS